MKRIFIVSVMALAVAGLSFAQVLSGVQAKDARSMGLGGSFTSLVTGFDAFKGNPAALASSRGQLTLTDVSTWLYVKPTQANVDSLSAIANDTSNIGLITKTVSGFVPDNGFGGGLSAGLGYAGRGLGLGVYAVGDVVATGSDALSAGLKSVLDLNAVVGIGVPIDLGFMTLSVGGDLRPFFRAEDDGAWLMGYVLGAASKNDTTALMNDLNALKMNAGFGVAADLGVQLKLWDLYFGMAVRDIGPAVKMAPTTVGTLFSSSSSEVEGTPYELDPTLAAAFAFRPGFLRGFLDPGIYAEFKAPLSGLSDAEISPWNYIHVGADLKFISMLTGRVGLNQGYLCAGVGLNLLLVEVNAAFFTQELGVYPGEQGRTGVSVQAALHL